MRASSSSNGYHTVHANSFYDASAHVPAHENSDFNFSYLSYFCEGNANMKCGISDNGFLSLLWPDGVSEMKHF